MLNNQQKQCNSDRTLSALKVQAYSLMPRDDSQLRHFRLGSEQFRSCHKRCPCECSDRWRIRKLSPDRRVRLKMASEMPKFHGVGRLKDDWSIQIPGQSASSLSSGQSATLSHLKRLGIQKVCSLWQANSESEQLRPKNPNERYLLDFKHSIKQKLN